VIESLSTTGPATLHVGNVAMRLLSKSQTTIIQSATPCCLSNMDSTSVFHSIEKSTIRNNRVSIIIYWISAKIVIIAKLNGKSDV